MAKAPADGYTLQMGVTFLAFNRATMKGLSYDSVADLAPVVRTGKAPFILTVPATLTLQHQLDERLLCSGSVYRSKKA